jgi:hypothetical protein
MQTVFLHTWYIPEKKLIKGTYPQIKIKINSLFKILQTWPYDDKTSLMIVLENGQSIHWISGSCGFVGIDWIVNHHC